jgi:hypothetical protein
MCLHKCNHQLLNHQFLNLTTYFVISKITLENMNEHERCQNLKLKTTHTHKKERSGIGVVVITTTQSTVKKKN